MGDEASFVLVPKQKFVRKEEPVESIYSKVVPTGVIVKILQSVQSVSQILRNTLNIKEKDSYPCDESYLQVNIMICVNFTIRYLFYQNLMIRMSKNNHS